MAKVSKITVSVTIIAVCVIVISSINLVKAMQRPDPAKSALARIKGNPAAPIHIVEFVDFQCGYCAQGAKDLREILKQHPNDIRLELRYFPLTSHVHGFTSARYAECAAQQEKFWPFEERLFENQQKWSGLVNPAPVFESLAKESNLDVPRLKACLQDKTIDEIIKTSRDEGSALGVKSTPTYFVNGKIAVGTNLLNQELAVFFNHAKQN